MDLSDVYPLFEDDPLYVITVHTSEGYTEDAIVAGFEKLLSKRVPIGSITTHPNDTKRLPRSPRDGKVLGVAFRENTDLPPGCVRIAGVEGIGDHVVYMVEE